MRSLLFIITFLSFYFCRGQEIINPESTLTELPMLNVLSNSEIGSTLVFRESGFKYNAIKITNGKDVKMGLGSVKIKNDDIFINKAIKGDYDLYESSYDTKVGIAINRVNNEMKVYAINSGVYFGKIKNIIEFDKISVIIPNKNYLRQEFLYNGKINNILKFSYREFFNDMARPAFTQDLQYDLSESKIIGFRGLRIEVITATNTNIEYKVISQFQK